MTNEIKLLMAFIEASGYEVETIITHNETPIAKQLGEIKATEINLGARLVRVNGEYKRGADECYYIDGGTSVDYEVTKKSDVEYKTPYCNKGGVHTNSIDNTRLMGFGVCSKCGEGLKLINNRWLSKS